MAYDDEPKTSAALEREIELQRSRVENTIDQIQQKLSPGQLVDELLAYSKGGGGEFVASLQRNVTANPLPVALLGVSLAWLMAKPAGSNDHDAQEEHYPVMVVSGSSLQRLGKTTDEQGRHFSEFTDDAGKKYRAQTDSLGNRAGHFADEAGSLFSGFTNAAGERIETFRDEAGNLLDEATGWASHTWQKARGIMRDASDTARSQADSGKQQAAGAAHFAQGQLDNLNRTVFGHFRDQPLVGGALAFALGAALGASLPHTPQEDDLIGDTADALKGKVGQAAADLYEQGKEKASELYESASEKVGEIYEQAKEGASGAIDATDPRGR
jgi:ElaB/YqjD/DUF883 family membrane-anchored ribosome-binding protein